MDFTNNPRPVGPGRPVPTSSGRPGSAPGLPERRMFNDFGARPMARPAAPGSVSPRPATSAPIPSATPRPFVSPAPTPPAKPIAPQPVFRTQTAPTLAPGAHHAQPHHQPPHHPVVSHSANRMAHHALQDARHQAAATQPQGAPTNPQAAAPVSPHSQSPAAAPQTTNTTPALPGAMSHTPVSKELKAGKPHNATAHAGLVGFLAFILLAGLLLSPLLPSKIFDNFPGSSVSQSSGDQTLACLQDPTSSTSTTSYHGKFGSPLNYKYATTTVQHATCDGKQQSADIGHISQFSPLALAIDVLLALGIAIGIAQIWRLIFGHRQD